MNILIKLTCLIGLVLAPILGGDNCSQSQKEKCMTEVPCAASLMKCKKSDASECAKMIKQQCPKVCCKAK